MPSVPGCRARLTPRAAFLLCAAWSLVAFAASDTLQQPAPAAEPVSVEALGFAETTPGKALEAAHREALLDARRNALIQAHTVVEADAKVADNRLTETVVRSRAAGYVQKMEVLESGLVPGASPPSYRVRVRAVIQPLPQFSSVPWLNAEGDRWLPKLVFDMTSDLPAERQAVARTALADALQRCGIAVVEPGQGRLALWASVSVRSAPPEPNASAKISYEIGVEPARLELTEEGKAPEPSPGQPLATATATLQGEWSERVALAMAQDAIRLWTTPRPTVVRFLGTDTALARQIAAVLRPLPGSRLETAANGSEVQATLNMAGDPVAALHALLWSSGISLTVDVRQTSLTRITYRRTPPPKPSAP